MRTLRTWFIALVIGVALIGGTVGTVGCAGNRTPQSIASTTANTGTVLVNAVSKFQDYVIAQEASGGIARNTAVTTMEGIGRGLTAAKPVPGYLTKLAALPSTSPAAGSLVNQIQGALSVINKDVLTFVAPGSSEAVRTQIAALLSAINGAVTAIDAQVTQIKGVQ